MTPSPDRQPRNTRPVTAERSLKLLRQLVGCSWPLERHWQNPSARSISFELQNTPTTPAISFLMVTASGSRSGDMAISFLDFNLNEEAQRQSVAQSIKNDIFSTTFVFRPDGSLRNRAIFNAICLIAETLKRDTESFREPRSLEIGEAEKVISKVVTNRLDFSSLLQPPAPRLYCDDSERLVSGAQSAWIEFQLASDRSSISLTFSQNINGTDYDPFGPSITIREPFCGGSQYRSGRVYSALRVLFAVDGLFTAPSAKEPKN